ncbi:hypothetical protein HK102_004092 [Quaeritorhiza haematococci]|nr:hypothetical protein HK102_004092 [Quaeritorhiza haematococci]
MSATEVVNKIVSSLLWVLFGHFSQSFDWLGFYIWSTNDFSIQKPIVRALVMMPFVRFWGDVLYRILNQTTSDFFSSVYPAILWYTGEIFGDSYLPYKALAMLGGGVTPTTTPRMQRIARWSILISFGLFASSKIAQIIWRFVAFYSLNITEAQFFKITSYMDGVVCFLGVFADMVSCYVMYKQSSDTLQMRKTGLIKMIKHSSVFRMSLAVGLKLMNGVFLILNPCEAEQNECYYGFLRSVITTIDYQFYYMDFFFSRYANSLDSQPQSPNTSTTKKMQHSKGSSNPHTAGPSSSLLSTTDA